MLTIAPPDPCLVLYPTVAWELLCERLDAAPRKDDRYRRFVRFLFAHTEEVTCDAQGRLLIPQTLRTYAGIEREARAIGSLGRIEIWAPNRLGDLAPSNDEAEAFAADLGLH